jgi:hypothetical protein
MGGKGSGRKPGPLPAGIGEHCDEAVGAMNGISASAVAGIRRRRGIPPSTEPHRALWFERRPDVEWPSVEEWPLEMDPG